MCAGFGWSNYRSPTDPKDCGQQQGWRGCPQLERCPLLLRLRPGLLVRGGHGAACRNYQYNYNHHPCAAAVPRRTWQVSSLPWMCSPMPRRTCTSSANRMRGIRGVRRSSYVSIYPYIFVDVCTDSKPSTVSMSMFKCLCTNLTSNKSDTIKISFHFTSHKPYFSSCKNPRTSISPVQ